MREKTEHKYRCPFCKVPLVIEKRAYTYKDYPIAQAVVVHSTKDDDLILSGGQWWTHDIEFRRQLSGEKGKAASSMLEATDRLVENLAEFLSQRLETV